MTVRPPHTSRISRISLCFFLGIVAGLAACEGGLAGPDGDMAAELLEPAYAPGGIPGPPLDIIIPSRIGPPPQARVRIPSQAGPPVFLSSMIAVGTGFDFSCALRADGAAFCWGDNMFGQLGDGTTVGSSVPVRVNTVIAFERLFVGDVIACGVQADGTAYCWGANDRGQLGAGLQGGTPSLVPVPVAPPHRFSDLSLGVRASCGMGIDGLAYCWGLNSNSWLGVGSPDAFTTAPMPVLNGAAIGLRSINTSGLSTTCGLAALGQVYCWGFGGAAFGNGTFNPSSIVPVAAASGAQFASIQVSHGYACALDGGGQALCWGSRNDSGEMGIGSTVDPILVPTPVVGGLTFASLDSDDTNLSLKSTCGVTAAGQGWCWGNNEFGQLGAPTTEICSPLPSFQFACSTSPVQVSGGNQFARITAGSNHACGLAVNGAVYCWGRNHLGQLGDGTLTDRSVPVPVRLN